MKINTTIVVALVSLFLVALAALIVWLGGGSRTVVVEDLPWDVRRLPDGGSEVFGWSLGRSTLKEVSDDVGAIPEVALFLMPGQDVSAEAYFGRVRLGVLEARLVVRLDIDQETLRAFAQRGIKSKAMPSGARKLELLESDLRVAYLSPIAAITYVPYARYDEATVLDRFGEPAERIATSPTGAYWLYPELGLAVLIETEGPNSLEYVDPRRFGVLRDQVLQRAQGPPAQ